MSLENLQKTTWLLLKELAPVVQRVDSAMVSRSVKETIALSTSAG